MSHAILLSCLPSSWKILLSKKSGLIHGLSIILPEKKSLLKVINKIKEASTFNEGYSCYRQLSFCFLDMAWHAITKPVETNISDFESLAMA